MDEVICNDCGWFGERDALVANVPGGDEEYCLAVARSLKRR